MEKNIEGKIQAYLAKRMNAAEKVAFEGDIMRDPLLGHKVLQALFKVGPTYIPADENILRIVQDIFTNNGESARPELTRWDWIRFRWYDLGVWKWGVAALPLAAIGIFVYLFFATPEPFQPTYLVDLMEEPNCGGTSGAQKPLNGTLDSALLAEAKQFYCIEEDWQALETLVREKCSGPCIADYYYAHALLLMKKFPEAAARFDTLMLHADMLALYQDYNTEKTVLNLKFNAILARMGSDPRDPELTDRIKLLLPQLEMYEDTYQKALELQEKIGKMR